MNEVVLPMADTVRNADKVVIDAALIRRLVDRQFPQWKDLPIRPVEHGGWDNRTFHLGDAMTVRLPSAAPYALQVEKEQKWLPRLAPLLPLSIPVPLAEGRPGEGYPWPWSIYGWIEGRTASSERIGDLSEFATAVGEFLVALQGIDTTGGPPPGQHNFWRGGSLTVYDGETWEAIAALKGKIDTGLAAEIWQAALAAIWEGTPVWFHGDVAWGNLLVDGGKLCAVIDFGTSGVGDPSCDLAIAWTLFKGESRKAFRTALPLDDATWARGRGWTLWKALIVYAGQAGTNPHEAEKSRLVLEEVMAEYRRMA
jgi:aminoglycoside phosphotransferase (APT) family kinase protein